MNVEDEDASELRFGYDAASQQAAAALGSPKSRRAAVDRNLMFDRNYRPEFPDDPECLSDKEVASFLHQRAQGNTREMKPHLRKAYDYARRSVGSKDMASVTDSAVSLRQALSELEFSAADGTVVQKLQRFEIASLANLMNKDSEPDEAKALLHSLHRFNDEQLTEMLDVISRNEI